MNDDAEARATPPDPPSGDRTLWGIRAADYVAISLAVLALSSAIGGFDALLWLRYERSAILRGEVWRLFTGHLVHLGWAHLALNLAGLGLIWLLFGRYYGVVQWIVIVVASAFGISLGFLYFHPELLWYVGLSGVLHGMFVAGAIGGILAGYRAEWLLLALLVLKLFWEQHMGPMAETERMIGGLVVVDAHLYGAIVGLGSALALKFAPRI
nr:hypothetical protein [uncultured bacterium]